MRAGFAVKGSGERLPRLVQKKGTPKDIQGLLRHPRLATTTDVYMQEIPESVKATIEAINRELRKPSQMAEVFENFRPISGQNSNT